MIVLDSCALVEMARQTDEGKALQWFIRTNEKVISCDLIRAELASVCRKFTRTAGYSAEQAEKLLTRSLDLIDEFYSIEGLQSEALRESVRLDHSTYDLFYFVLARRTGATLLTADKKLMHLCEDHGVSCVSEILLDPEE